MPSYKTTKNELRYIFLDDTNCVHFAKEDKFAKVDQQKNNKINEVNTACC